MKKNILVLTLISLSVTLAALFVGASFINPLRADSLSREILFSIRLPRIAVSVLIGSSLGASGAVLQGLLRNPLADPYILGISSGAALFASAGLMLGTAFLGPFTIPLMAFAGASLTAAVVGGMGWKKGVLWPDRLLLAGIGVGFLFTAVLMLIMTLSTNYGLRRTLLWIFGDLSMSDWSLVPTGAVLVAAGLIITLARAKGLNALSLGDDMAHSLGFSPSRERFLLFTSVSLMTATSVSLGGVVGFVGLLIPHIVRFAVGSDARVLVPLSAIAGAGLVVFADMMGRTVMAPMEVPSGIITAIIGAPYFLYLLRKKDVFGV
ncbi:MAG: iron ABC transporter permease [Deltaproteobacteria bacterium]|nr:iron ABC transporter permease [Deltaproteobacteria bacterium]